VIQSDPATILLIKPMRFFLPNKNKPSNSNAAAIIDNISIIEY
jgi:hypothetical protein